MRVQRKRAIETTGRIAVKKHRGVFLLGIILLLCIPTVMAAIFRHIGPSSGYRAVTYIVGFMTLYTAGWLTRNYASTRRFSDLLFVSGAILYGAGVFHVAHSSHVAAFVPHGPLAWALTVLPLAYLFEIPTLVTVIVISSLVWIGMETAASVSVMGSGSFAAIPVALVMAGAILILLGNTQKYWSRGKFAAGICQRFGMLTMLMFGLPLTFDIYRYGIASNQQNHIFLALFIVGLLSITITGFNLKRDNGTREFIELGGLSSVILLLFAATTFPGRILGLSARIFGYILANAIFIGGTAWLIKIGMEKGNRFEITCGICFVGGCLVCRSAELFFRMMPSSLGIALFSLTACVVGIGAVWTHRKISGSFVGARS